MRCQYPAGCLGECALPPSRIDSRTASSSAACGRCWRPHGQIVRRAAPPASVALSTMHDHAHAHVLQPNPWVLLQVTNENEAKRLAFYLFYNVKSDFDRCGGARAGGSREQRWVGGSHSGWCGVRHSGEGQQQSAPGVRNVGALLFATSSPRAPLQLPILPGTPTPQPSPTSPRLILPPSPHCI